MSEVYVPISTTRTFRYVRLENKLTVILVSQPDTKTAACCLAVSSGSFHDPPDRYGLSHFLEHMLFLGNKKYPKEDQFQHYVEMHSGSTNAATGSDQTWYYFQVDSAYLDGALDGFSAFFIDPLFNESATGREVNAVNSEFEIDLNNPRWKFKQLVSNMTLPTSYLHIFDVGNNQTLHPEGSSLPETRSRLIDLFKRYYTAQNMAVCIIGSGLFHFVILFNLLFLQNPLTI